MEITELEKNMSVVFPLPNEAQRTRVFVKTRMQEIQLQNPNFTLRVLSERVKVNTGSISSYLKGGREFSVRRLLSILKELQSSENEIHQCIGISLDAIKEDHRRTHSSH